MVPISGMSENAFKTVMEIDTVGRPIWHRSVCCHDIHLFHSLFLDNKIGSYNTIKATLSHIRASKGAYIHVSATLHYKGKGI